MGKGNKVINIYVSLTPKKRQTCAKDPLLRKVGGISEGFWDCPRCGAWGGAFLIPFIEFKSFVKCVRCCNEFKKVSKKQYEKELKQWRRKNEQTNKRTNV